MNIGEFQQLMRDLYFHNDNKRGVHRTALWLGEEVGELLHELKTTQEQIDLDAVGEELADVFAWGASIANILEISLEKVINRKYPGKCPKCNANPCRCEKDI